MSKMIDLSGMKFGKLTVICLDHIYITPCKQKIAYWKCICDCGNEKVVRGTSLKSGYAISCGCYKKDILSKIKSENLTGQQFGYLIAKEKVKRGKDRHNIWKCICTRCGNECFVASNMLKQGHTTSCGCIGQSRGEAKTEDLLKKYNVQCEKEYSFNDLFGPNSGLLRFDFKINNPHNNDFALIEFQGEQHYREKPRNFGLTQRNITDKMKKEYCSKNKIKLFEIKESDNIEYELLSILSNLFQVNPVPSLNKEGVTTIRKGVDSQ